MINQNNFDGSSAQRSPESNKSSIHMYKTMQEQHVLNTSRVHVARRGPSIVCSIVLMDQLWNLMRDPQHVQLFLKFWHDSHDSPEVLVDLQVAGQNLAMQQLHGEVDQFHSNLHLQCI